MDPETRARNRLEQMLLDESAEPTDLPLSLLTAITDNFSDDQKIGSGEYAVVYKGVLRNGTVAVKKFKEYMDEDDRIFIQEVRCLMRAKHKNIIRFFGYCAHAQGELANYEGSYIIADNIRHRLLCFEYVPGGSLHNYITDVSLGLEWRMRYQIIRGICEGLNYLHEMHIVHFDLKPDKILLDHNMVPKICDSRFFNPNESRHMTNFLPNLSPYIAPEIFNGGEITFKFDIYALGVIITEILTGQKQYSSVVNVLEAWRNRLGTSGEDRQLEQIIVCADICVRCLDKNPNKRPAIQRIMEDLNETESLAPGTQHIIEMLNDEDIEDGAGTLLTQEHSSVVQQGTLKISGVESSEIELNILELILAGSEEPMHIDFMLLQSVTENFSEKQKVGVGGCGEVYKGILQNGVVVVKRLFKTRTIKDKMFHREVKSLITARHENIVRFLGYCSVTEERALTFGEETIMFDIRERLLCFEYIRNGSLDNYLTDELRGLEWHTRYEIVVGICKGLLYLHKKGIIHMDLKPANILLDDRMVPKITDFGLSRLDNNSQTTTTSRLVSPGYCAPEYLLEGKSSRKSDMYSYGVLINELMTGTKKMPNITKILRRWKHRWITSSKHTALGYQQVTKCLELAQRCMQIDPNGRPDISDIIDELNEIDSKDDQFQVIPCLEDMLGIEPLEIQFPFEEHDQQISHSVELINDTDDYFAFITKTSLCCLHTEPDKGIVTPRSKCNITVTMMQDQVISLQSNRYKEKITVLSTRADGGLAVTDITRDMFIEKEGKVVDEVDMTVLFGMPPSAEES